MIEMMFNGGCAAALLGKDDYRVYISGSKAIFTVSIYLRVWECDTVREREKKRD